MTKEHTNGHKPEIRAQAGTYDFLRGIENGRLGNSSTWRKVTISQSEDNPENLEVSVRVIIGRKATIHYLYSFKITPQDRVEDLKGERRQLYPHHFTPLKDFDFLKVFGEIQTALMLQPSLR